MADNNSSDMNAIVAIVAIIAILVVGYFAIQMFAGEAPATNGTGIDVNLGSNGGDQ